MCKTVMPSSLTSYTPAFLLLLRAGCGFIFSKHHDSKNALSRGILNPFTPKSAKSKNDEKIQNFILQNCQKQTSPLESTLNRFHLNGHTQEFHPQAYKRYNHLVQHN